MGKTIWDLVNADNSITNSYRSISKNMVPDPMKGIIPDAFKTLTPDVFESYKSFMD